jgi:hypothetical protein
MRERALTKYTLDVILGPLAAEAQATNARKSRVESARAMADREKKAGWWGKKKWRPETFRFYHRYGHVPG